jgi:hypothetical protein
MKIFLLLQVVVKKESNNTSIGCSTANVQVVADSNGTSKINKLVVGSKSKASYIYVRKSQSYVNLKSLGPLEHYTSSIIRYHIVLLIYTKIEVLDTILSFYTTYKTHTGKVILGNISFMARCAAFEDPVAESAYQKKRERWVDRKTTAYSYLVEACIPHNTSNRQNVQQSVKQSEITKFNTLVMESGEARNTFVDRVSTEIR